ncbi:MAG: glycosyltransferase family 4 protein [Thermodesulfobacteriota bacterium]
MKILLINDYGIPQGGAEVQISRLRQLLRERGHDARLFTTDLETESLKNVADYKCTGTVSSFRTLLQTFNPMAYLRLREVIREFKPDIVHVKIFLTQLSPLILPLLSDIPCLHHIAWYRPVCPTGIKFLRDGDLCTVRAGISCYRNGCLPLRDWLPLMIQMKLFRRWRRVFDFTLTISESARDTLFQNGIDPVEVLQYGIPGKPEGNSLSETPTVVFAGRLVREKGVNILLRAFVKITRQLPSVKLLIAGDGPEREKLDLLISELNLSSYVTFHGHLSLLDIDKTFSGAWVQVVPSVWAEPFGITAVEAMMRGTAIIASDSGGLREIIENGKSGILVPPGDADALADKLMMLLKDKGLSESLGKAGRRRAELRYGEEQFLDKIIGIYETLYNTRYQNKSA